MNRTVSYLWLLDRTTMKWRRRFIFGAPLSLYGNYPELSVSPTFRSEHVQGRYSADLGVCQMYDERFGRITGNTEVSASTDDFRPNHSSRSDFDAEGGSVLLNAYLVSV